MSDSDQDQIVEKRKYVKSGNPRSSLWVDICKEHNVKNYRKDSQEYERVRKLYTEALELKKRSKALNIIVPKILSTIDDTNQNVQ